MAALAWKGTLDTLENRGPWALRLAAPATVQLARARVRVGATQLAVADGNVRLAEFAWDDGRIATSGSFAARAARHGGAARRRAAAVRAPRSRWAANGRSRQRRA